MLKFSNHINKHVEKLAALTLQLAVASNSIADKVSSAIPAATSFGPNKVSISWILLVYLAARFTTSNFTTASQLLNHNIFVGPLVFKLSATDYM